MTALLPLQGAAAGLPNDSVQKMPLADYPSEESLQQQEGEMHLASGGRAASTILSPAHAGMGEANPMSTQISASAQAVLPPATHRDPTSSRDQSPCPRFPAERGTVYGCCGHCWRGAIRGWSPHLKRTPKGFVLCLYHYKCCKLLTFLIWSVLPL